MNKNSKYYLFLKKYLGWFVRPIKNRIRPSKEYKHMLVDLNNFKETVIACKEENADLPCIYYFGITAHSNLGDLAQHYCILKWIEENYSSYHLLKVESDAICYKRTIFFNFFKKYFVESKDIILFQSGYCTQDLGGNHPLMHCLIIDAFPNAQILMMPQTVYFQHKKNAHLFSENHNKARHMLFLARDFVSYDKAKELFPKICVKAFPDIVTTLIGLRQYKNLRLGVCFCTRNDGEKLYSDEALERFSDKIRMITRIIQKDTTIEDDFLKIRNDLERYIWTEIESYSNYKVTVTDRYHGTIFSLCAGTPVIILKTTDHKVITGADWFKGIYDDYVYVAEDLDDAYLLCQKVLAKKLNHQLQPHFKAEYYDGLKNLFSKIIRGEAR